MQSTPNLKIMTWNSRGLSASIPYLRHLVTQCDIICITEHWLFENNLNKLNDISNGHCFVAHASLSSSADTFGIRRGQGGVAILWDKKLTGITPIDEIVHDRVCGVRLQCKSGQVLNIMAAYMPARGCDGDLATSFDELSGIIEARETGAYNIICGDLNGDIGASGGSKSRKQPDHRGKIVYEFMQASNLFATNLQPHAEGGVNTFNGPNGSSCLDYILMPNDMRGDVMCTRTLEVEPLNTSDHVPVCVHLCIDNIDRCYIEVTASHRLKWEKLSAEQLNTRFTTPVSLKLRELEALIDESVPSPDLIDGSFDTICKILRQAEIHIPKSKYKANLKPFWCPRLNQLKNDKVILHRAWKEAGCPRGIDNPIKKRYKDAEKSFRKALKEVSKKYDDERILHASKSADLDRNTFWRLLKRNKKNSGAKVLAIRNSAKKVVYDVDSILETWRLHFAKLCTPLGHPDFDQAHYVHVTDRVKMWAGMDDTDDFTRDVFTVNEVRKGVTKLNTGKAPGHDMISTEHLRAAGDSLVPVLTKLFRLIIAIEYVPKNFRCGIQIPLYKGKQTSSLDPNNYRGITLLSSFNKLFEIVIWERVKVWWKERQIISELQGAATPGVSCLHTALLLQEAIAVNLENHNKILVSFYDVSKAFDGIWVDGLFYQLRELGITGKLWRVLYLTYQNFMSRVRIQNKLSNWYPMLCGIHQGGYLSLIKYVSFINSLLIELKDSGLCCTIGNLQVTPPGYADDLATACISKDRMDRVMRIVHRHGNRWRYHFNAEKSAVLVYGESDRERKINSKQRIYRLGKSQVKEREVYDHVGVKASVTGNNYTRASEKISKGRKALNAATSLGVKRYGLTMQACSTIFWSMIIPIVTYGSELWILDERDIDMLDSFQRYAGRRVQRFHNRSPKQTSFVGLGWMRIESFINGKKLLFVRSILSMDAESVYRKIFVQRFTVFNNDVDRCSNNTHKSPIFDILRVAIILGLYDRIRGMVNMITCTLKPPGER